MKLSLAEAEAVPMIERKEPRFENFEKRGTRIFGILTSVAKAEVTDKVSKKKKEIVRYTVDEPEAGPVAFIGTYQLNELLSPGDKGSLVCITFGGTRETANGAMKEFKVTVSEGKIMETDARFDSITDDDIGF